MIPAPTLDSRTRQQIYERLSQRLDDQLGIDVRDDQLAETLLRIFSRFGEHLVQRLNRVPDRNFLYFLNRLNVSRRPAHCARVPLTFTPVAKLPPDRHSIVVPAGTKVAAAPDEGEETPVVFETCRDLHVTNWQLRSILVEDRAADCWADLSHLADPTLPADGRFAFWAAKPAVHAFYIGQQTIFAQPHLTTLTLRFSLHLPLQGRPRGRRLVWERISADGTTELFPETDTTDQLCRSGDVVFQDLPPWPESDLHGHANHWLGCRLVDDPPAGGGAGDASPPEIGSLQLVANRTIPAAPPTAAFFNTTALDLTKDFFPLGQAPRFGDVFCLNCAAWAQPGAVVTLTVKLTNPASSQGPLPIPAVNNQGRAVVQWECWCGKQWRTLPVSDGTRALTEDGSITFSLPDEVAPLTLQGVDGTWLRARLAGGHYGHPSPPGDTGTTSRQPLSPPAIETLLVRAAHTFGPAPPEAILIRDNLIVDCIDPDLPFSPFFLPREPTRSLFFGFQAAMQEKPTAGRIMLDLYAHVSGSQDRLSFCLEDKTASPTLEWQYRTQNGWRRARVLDDTAALTRSGMVRIDLPSEMAVWDRIALARGLFWLRAIWTAGDYGCRPHLQRVLLNTVAAEHAMTVTNEVLGSSTGLPNQQFHTARYPLLEVRRLEVREPELPPSETSDAVTVVKDAHDRTEPVWVRWHAADDVGRSDHRGRQFTVDHQSGTIFFGDGRNGRIPPTGSNNIRLASYRTGGGQSGNKPAHRITQLRASVPFIDSVTNHLPAVGGRDIESWAHLKTRGATELRHRRRAVTLEDYEDLAAMAVPSIARAKCLANRDLAADPDGGSVAPGVASLIVVPRDTVPRPVPDLATLQRAAAYLDRHKAADARLIILEPEYVQMNVAAAVTARPSISPALVAQRCQAAVEAFLHPTDGGAQGWGWLFGQRPHDSDILGLLGQVPGVDRIERLATRLVEPRPGLLESGLFLISAGVVDISPEYEAPLPEEGYACP